MRGKWMLALALTAGTGLAAEAAAASLADRLIADSAKIKTVRCEIRRELEVEGTTLPTLSRVWFERPDRLRVETTTPEPRRIVADGKAIYKWLDGQEAGVRIPFAEAPEMELIQVRKTPGTAEEHLIRLRGMPEEALPPAEGFPARFGYTPPVPHPYTVLSLDATGRLARLEFFDPAVRTNRLLVIDFTAWKEVGPGAWIPCLQKTAVKGRDGTVINESLRVGGLIVNEPIEPEQFDIVKQAPGVRFITPVEAEKGMKKP